MYMTEEWGPVLTVDNIFSRYPLIKYAYLDYSNKLNNHILMSLLWTSSMCFSSFTNVQTNTA